MSKDGIDTGVFEQISEGETSWLGRLGRKIPGFKGYLEAKDRREADQILRQTISGRMEEVRRQLGGVHEELSRDIIKAMDHAEPLGRIDTRLMGLVGKIKDAPTGYSGFFDAAKIDNEDLEKIYNFDENMLTYVDQIGAGVGVLEQAVREDGDIGGAVRSLDAVCREAVDTFNSRNEALSGLG